MLKDLDVVSVAGRWCWPGRMGAEGTLSCSQGRDLGQSPSPPWSWRVDALRVPVVTTRTEAQRLGTCCGDMHSQQAWREPCPRAQPVFGAGPRAPAWCWWPSFGDMLCPSPGDSGRRRFGHLAASQT